MGPIVAPKRSPVPKRHRALPWAAGVASLVIHAGIVAALVGGPETPPEPLPVITLELAPGPPGSKAARAGKHVDDARARTGEETATPAPPKPVATAKRVPPVNPKAETVTPPANDRVAERKKPDATATPVDPPRTAKAAPPPEPKATPQPATTKPATTNRTKPPAAKRRVPRRVAKATPRRRPPPSDTDAGKRPAKGRQVAALPGRKKSFTPPRYGVGGGVNRPPAYPRRARRLGWEGRVVLRVRVDARGRVKTVNLGRSSGYDILDRAALAAVRGWRFSPATRGATPVAAWVEVPIRFRLTDGS